MSKHAKAVRYAAARYLVTDSGAVVNRTTGKVLKLQKRLERSKHYYRFCVAMKKSRRAVRVHKLAAFLKFGPKALLKRIQIRHLDDDSLNNAPANLFLGTNSSNQKDRFRNARKRRLIDTDFETYYTALKRKIGIYA